MKPLNAVPDSAQLDSALSGSVPDPESGQNLNMDRFESYPAAILNKINLIKFIQKQLFAASFFLNK